MKFTIKGTLPSLNNYISANRTNKNAGAEFKKDYQRIIGLYIKKAKLKPVKKYPITLRIKFYEPNKRRDLDNVQSFSTKIIQDALVTYGILENDNQKCINKLENNNFYLDRKNPRIEVEIEEVEE